MERGQVSQDGRIIPGVSVVVEDLLPIDLLHLPGGDDRLHASVEGEEAVERGPPGIRRPPTLTVGREHLRCQGACPSSLRLNMPPRSLTDPRQP